MKIIFIIIGIIVLAIIGGLTTLSMIDVTIKQENIRKEIKIESSVETPAATPAPLPIQ